MCCGQSTTEELSLVRRLVQQGYTMRYVEYVGPRGPQVKVGANTGETYVFHRGARTFVETGDLSQFNPAEFKVLS